MAERCEVCRFSAWRVTGVVECSMHPDGWVDIHRFECRRFPPQRGFWADRYPTPTEPCGEFQPRKDEK